MVGQYIFTVCRSVFVSIYSESKDISLKQIDFDQDAFNEACDILATHR